MEENSNENSRLKTHGLILIYHAPSVVLNRVKWLKQRKYSNTIKYYFNFKYYGGQ